MRQRIEDLGRLTVMVKHLMDHDLFDERPQRNKDIVDWFMELSDELKSDWVHAIVYKIADVEEKIGELWEIATGQDYLNDPPE